MVFLWWRHQDITLFVISLVHIFSHACPGLQFVLQCCCRIKIHKNLPALESVFLKSTNKTENEYRSHRLRPGEKNALCRQKPNGHSHDMHSTG